MTAIDVLADPISTSYLQEERIANYKSKRAFRPKSNSKKTHVLKAKANYHIESEFIEQIKAEHSNSSIDTSTEKLDSVRSGDSLIKHFRFNKVKRNGDIEKCIAFWELIKGETTLKPVRNDTTAEMNGLNSNSKQTSYGVGKYDTHEAKEIICNFCNNQSGYDNWYKILQYLQKYNMDKDAVVSTIKPCGVCKTDNKYNNFKKKQKEIYSTSELLDYEDLIQLNNFKTSPQTTPLPTYIQLDIKDETKERIEQKPEEEECNTFLYCNIIPEENLQVTCKCTECKPKHKDIKVISKADEPWPIVPTRKPSSTKKAGSDILKLQPKVKKSVTALPVETNIENELANQQLYPGGCTKCYHYCTNLHHHQEMAQFFTSKLHNDFLELSVDEACETDAIQKETPTCTLCSLCGRKDCNCKKAAKEKRNLKVTQTLSNILPPTFSSSLHQKMSKQPSKEICPNKEILMDLKNPLQTNLKVKQETHMKFELGKYNLHKKNSKSSKVLLKHTSWCSLPSETTSKMSTLSTSTEDTLVSLNCYYPKLDLPTVSILPKYGKKL